MQPIPIVAGLGSGFFWTNQPDVVINMLTRRPVCGSRELVFAVWYLGLKKKAVIVLRSREAMQRAVLYQR